MNDDLEILVDENGDVQFVYSDTLADIFPGESSTARASNVEPAPFPACGRSHGLPDYSTGPDYVPGTCHYCARPVGWGWAADLAPVGGPVLGPFRTRAEALGAEVAWLRTEMTTRTLRVAK